VRVEVDDVLLWVTDLSDAYLAGTGQTTVGGPYVNDDAVEVTTASGLVAELTAGHNVAVKVPLASGTVVSVNRPSITGTCDTLLDSPVVSNVTASGTLEVGMRFVGAGPRLEYEAGYADGGIPFGAKIVAISGTDVTLSAPCRAGIVGVGFTAAMELQIGTAEGGSIPWLALNSASWVTVHARVTSIRADYCSFCWIDNCVLGGEQTARVYDPLLYIPNDCSDMLITANDIGWTLADNSGTTGYGIRLGGVQDRCAVVGNKVHDTASDCLQGLGFGVDQVFDRNELGPGGANPGSDEHTDLIQSIFNWTGCRITNNWLHHQGYYDGAVTGNAGATYLHGDDVPSDPGFYDGDLLYQNNLVETSRGRVEVGGLGSGGNRRAALTMRRNTFYDLGRARDQFGGFFPGFEWDVNELSTGPINVLDRNIFLDVNGGLTIDPATIGVTVLLTDNITGDLTDVEFDGQMNALSPEANPAGEDPIGYRHPVGVHW